MMINAFACFLLHSALLFSCIVSTLPMRWANAPPATSLGNETDRLALLAFKAQITDDPQQALNSWNTSLHFCMWHGVTCGHRHQRVVRLDLMSQGLVGSLSPYIGNLSFLHSINLANNSFHGEIPSEVGRLFRLQEFELNNNSFSGGIPINLSYCSNLVTVSLGYNKLSGMLPKELGSLSKLVTLLLLVNNLTGRIPPSLGNISSLETIRLSYNSLDGSIPDSFGQLNRLQGLGLSNNRLSSMVPPSIYNLSSLQILAVGGNQIHGSLPQNIGLTLPNLQNLIIGRNYFSGSIPTSLCNISNLQKIDMNANDITGEMPRNLGSLMGLQLLNFGYNHIGTGQADDLNFLPSLVNCSNLQVLNMDFNQLGGILHRSMTNLSSQLHLLLLGGNQISGFIPSEIENLVNLFACDLFLNQLAGSIPVSIGKLHNLQYLDLGGNKLSGKIPSSLSNLSQLTYLNLSMNNLEGEIVHSISNYHSMLELDLSTNNLRGTIKHLFLMSFQLVNLFLNDNSFTGALPLEVGNLENLVLMDVSNNKMSGEIPSMLGKCLSLRMLSLMGNSFQGSIPLSFRALKGLEYLDLSLNNLSGQIPMFLQNLSSLRYLNLSFNGLEGEVPMEGVFQNTSVFWIDGNKKLCGGISKLQLHACPTQKSKKHGKHLFLKLSLGAILPMIVLVSSLLLCWMKRTKKETVPDQHILKDTHFERVSFHELHKATDGFASANLIGMGHFGSVFKGIIHEDEGPVAIKVLNLMEHDASKSFMVECEALRKIRHRNLLKILTACDTVDFEGNDFKALVFKFMPNGSLDDWLHPTSNGRYLFGHLDFLKRINIAIDIASALDYLHNQCETSIIHCDLKPSNILLDEEMVAHVGDFGIAKLLQENNNSGEKETSSISPKGTIGYIPPEYGTSSKASRQGDVFSYGVLLLEMMTGKRPTNDMFKDGLDLHCFSMMALSEQVMTIVDPRMFSEEDGDQTIIIGSNIRSDMRNKVQECLSSMVRVGVACSTISPMERMDIKNALKELLSIKKLYLEIRTLE